MAKGISILVPVHREGDKLLKSFKHIEKFYKIALKHSGVALETIIFQDSIDIATEKIVRQIANVRALNNNLEQGKGWAIKQLLLNAKYDTCIVVDADMSVNPNQFWKYEGILKLDYPILYCGYRNFKVKQSKMRQLTHFGWKKLVKTLFDLPVDDTQTPFKVLHKIPKDIVKQLTISGFAYDVQLIDLCIQNKIFVKELNVDYYDDPDSSVTFKKAFTMFIDLLKIRSNR